MNKDQKLLEEAYKLVSKKKKRLYKTKPDGSVIWLGKGPDLTGAPEVVEGGFRCDGIRSLKSLKGGPKIVKGDYYYCFDCGLESLEGAPEIIEGNFYCSQNRHLKSLKGGPKIVKGDYNCRTCDIESLDGAPEFVGNHFFCGDNRLLKTLKGGPKVVKGDYSCYNCCNLESLEGAPEVVGGSFYCLYTSLKSLRGLPKAKSYQLPEIFTDADIKKELKRQEILNTTDKDTKDTFGDLIRNI